MSKEHVVDKLVLDNLNNYTHNNRTTIIVVMVVSKISFCIMPVLSTNNIIQKVFLLVL